MDGFRRFAIVAALLAVSGCATQGTIEGDGVPPAVYDAWHKGRSYYALLQIVDAHIDPDNYNTATKEDVRKHLGEPIDDPELYPNAGPDYWVYISSRRGPNGSYLIIEFDSQGKVKGIDWVSE